MWESRHTRLEFTRAYHGRTPLMTGLHAMHALKTTGDHALLLPCGGTVQFQDVPS